MSDDMALRDWFAGQALTAYLTTRPSEGTWTYEELAQKCYRAADALLAERGRKPATEEDIR